MVLGVHFLDSKIVTCVDGGETLIPPSFAAIGVCPLVDRFADFAFHGFSGLSQFVDHTLQKKPQYLHSQS